MSVVTRFAPSPTGFLHIGGARTALFNWLFARHHGGRFLLRVEDTDRARSSEAAIAAIFEGLRWLGLDWDGEAVMQSQRADRHVEAVTALLDAGHAYRCYASVDELAAMRDQARAAGRSFRYDGRWRDRDPAEAPAGVAPAVRLRAPETGVTRIRDHVQGEVEVANAELDDMVLLRADGTPTYMLAVVVDDHDMGISHVIRGDDHLSNTFRQLQLYRAFGWSAPEFAHLPLLHGADGAKLSKRHGALGVEAYRDMGFLPEAVCNYLLRLGWSHCDDEIIARDQAIEWFGLEAIGRSPARFDPAKLTSLNAHYLRQADPERLLAMLLAALSRRLGDRLSPMAPARLARGLQGLRERARTIVDLTDSAIFYGVDAPIDIAANARALLTPATTARLAAVRDRLGGLVDWQASALEAELRRMTAELDPPLALKDVAQPLRAAITGQTVSPPIFEAMSIIGREETLARLGAVIALPAVLPGGRDTADAHEPVGAYDHKQT